MSRVGKQLIHLPSGVTTKLNGTEFVVQGPRGQLSISLHDHVIVTNEEQCVKVAVRDEEKKSDRALWGLFARLISNSVKGVTEGFEKKLEINGIGFKVAASGRDLTFSLGFSHPVHFRVPDDIEVKVEKNIITVSGSDKQHVGETAARIRRLKKPEPYKGKGIKYLDEVIRRKAGKAGKAGAK